MTALLDVSVLVALHNREHVFHHEIYERFTKTWCLDWASCPLTENGFVRVTAQLNPKLRQAHKVARSALVQTCANTSHQFWPDDQSILQDGFLNWDAIQGHRQITDAYLLGLAQRRAGRFVTLDRRINSNLIVESSDVSVEVIAL